MISAVQIPSSVIHLVKNLKKQQFTNYSKQVPLKYGYRVQISEEQRLAAKQLNSFYERQVWGTSDDADNQTLSKEETLAIKEWIDGTPYGFHVLEVGCGSGRFTVPLLNAARSVTALDREKDTFEALSRKIPKKLIKKMRLLCTDFSQPLNKKNQFSSVIMIENLIGMNPRVIERRKIIKNAASLLMKKGILIIGFRVHPANKENEMFYQAMPYGNLFGLAINWSVSCLLREVSTFSNQLKMIITIPGSNRPAGGKMYLTIFEKL